MLLAFWIFGSVSSIRPATIRIVNRASLSHSLKAHVGSRSAERAKDGQGGQDPLHFTTPGGVHVNATPGQVQAFFNLTAPGAQAGQRQNGVLASIAMAVSADETGYGQNTFSQQDNDYFNITCGANGSGYTYSPRAIGTVWNGSYCYLTYASIEDSFLDFGYFLTHDPHYTNLISLLNSEADADTFIADMYTDGYAGTGNIATVESIRDTYDLAQYDNAALPTPQSGSNIVQNGNFGNGIAGWTKYSEQGGIVNASVMGGSGLPGTVGYGANGNYLEANTSVSSNSIYQDVSSYALPAGTPFLAGVWVRSPTGTPLNVTLSLWEMGGASPSIQDNVAYTTSGSQWQFIMVRHIIAASDRSALRLQLYMSSASINYDFGDPFLMVQPVSSELYSAQYLGVSGPPAQTMTGQPYQVTVSYKNTGQLPWYRAGANPAGDNPVNLGTAEPDGRHSAFYTPGQGWQGAEPGSISDLPGSDHGLARRDGHVHVYRNSPSHSRQLYRVVRPRAGGPISATARHVVWR